MNHASDNAGSSSSSRVVTAPWSSGPGRLPWCRLAPAGCGVSLRPACLLKGGECGLRASWEGDRVCVGVLLPNRGLGASLRAGPGYGHAHLGSLRAALLQGGGCAPRSAGPVPRGKHKRHSSWPDGFSLASCLIACGWLAALCVSIMWSWPCWAATPGSVVICRPHTVRGGLCLLIFLPPRGRAAPPPQSSPDPQGQDLLPTPGSLDPGSLLCLFVSEDTW